MWRNPFVNCLDRHYAQLTNSCDRLNSRACFYVQFQRLYPSPPTATYHHHHHPFPPPRQAATPESEAEVGDRLAAAEDLVKRAGDVVTSLSGAYKCEMRVRLSPAPATATQAKKGGAVSPVAAAATAAAAGQAAAGAAAGEITAEAPAAAADAYAEEAASSDPIAASSTS